MEVLHLGLSCLHSCLQKLGIWHLRLVLLRILLGPSLSWAWLCRLTSLGWILQLIGRLAGLTPSWGWGLLRWLCRWLRLLSSWLWLCRWLPLGLRLILLGLLLLSLLLLLLLLLLGLLLLLLLGLLLLLMLLLLGLLLMLLLTLSLLSLLRLLLGC
jgi:hypothetical protein